MEQTHIRLLMTVSIHSQPKHPIAGDFNHDFILARIDGGLGDDMLHPAVFLVAWHTVLV